MVDLQLRRRGIRDERVLAAMLGIPREEFVPLESRLIAYQDGPIHIGEGQTISQPYMTALMAESLELRGTEHVLEVGAGCGYAAAVLGALAASVITLEILPRLAKQARDNLRRAGRDYNVRVVTGDGSAGYREGAPYDAISVAAGAPEIPAALVEQGGDGRSGVACADHARRTYGLPRVHVVPFCAAARRRGLAIDAIAHGQGPAEDRAQHH